MIGQRSEWYGYGLGQNDENSLIMSHLKFPSESLIFSLFNNLDNPLQSLFLGYIIKH